jgi:hypothetical protein
MAASTFLIGDALSDIDIGMRSSPTPYVFYFRMVKEVR